MDLEKFVTKYFDKKNFKKIIENELFREYFKLLCKWKKNINIVGFNDKEIFFRAIVEPLLILKKNIELDDMLIDIGTGAGIPSISYAIFFQNLKVYGIEINKKRFAFLEYVKQELNLVNFFPAKNCPKKTKWITARAFMSIDDFMRYLKQNNIYYKYLLFFFKNRPKRNINDLVLKENICYYFNQNRYEISIFRKERGV